jgi:RHS repeat-associated protein
LNDPGFFSGGTGEKSDPGSFLGTNYYPFGLTMAGISDKALKSNYAQNKYRYNGKELQNQEFSDGSGLEEYDYGARFQDPQLGRFFTQDRFADKYFQLTPYQYGGNNPMSIVDENGDSLIVGGSASATQSFQQIANTGLGNIISVSPTGTGAYAFDFSAVAPAGVDAATALDAAKSLMTPGQAAFADVLNDAMTGTDATGNAVDTKFTAVDGNDAISHSVFVGDNGISTETTTRGVHTLDVGDMKAFGSTGALTSQGALGHEIAEGTRIQSKYGGEAAAAESPFSNGISSEAHYNFALPAEDRINGTASGGARPSPSGDTIIPVTVGGVTKTVTIHFTNGNILPGGIQNNTR